MIDKKVLAQMMMPKSDMIRENQKLAIRASVSLTPLWSLEPDEKERIIEAGLTVILQVMAREIEDMLFKALNERVSQGLKL